MRRFSLIGRLGPDDKASVKPVQTDSAVYEIDFLDGDRRMGFGIGQALDQIASLGLRSSERAIDLVLLAALVNAGDTRVSRSMNAQDGWTREVDLYVPVSAPKVWNDERQRIEALLKFLTGDRWRVFFHARSARTIALAIQPKRVAIDGLTEVSLLSGGLDSLISAIDLLAKGKRPLFVSHYWDAETAKAQTCVLRALEKHFSENKIKSMRVRLGFDRHHLDTREREATQRGRSFLFYALAAWGAGRLGVQSAHGGKRPGERLDRVERPTGSATARGTQHTDGPSPCHRGHETPDRRGRTFGEFLEPVSTHDQGGDGLRLRRRRLPAEGCRQLHVMRFPGEGAVQETVTPPLRLLRALPDPQGFLEGWSGRERSDALHGREPARENARDRPGGG